ncbi:hypothetical protein BRCON_1130 [Candidatus Sumerlaea chitinivorans]|uniref:Uncharacterized protein n=1 Tax=Sumerlaea chitinivorans TaxID=2250252 RepID=A0A2Z4Y3W5_SUMC1|nr:hypothetical protein BRCON_1130 [Candidatus Sumerlaea chitinivorans]
MLQHGMATTLQTIAAPTNTSPKRFDHFLLKLIAPMAING